MAQQRGVVKLHFNNLNVDVGQSNYLFSKHLKGFIDQLQVQQAHVQDLYWAGKRLVAPTLKYYFQTFIDQIIWSGHAWFHHSKIDLTQQKIIKDSKHPFYNQLAFTFPYRLHVVCGNDCGSLPRTPMEVGSCLIAMVQFGNLLGCLNSLYNCVQLMLSYKTDHEPVGYDAITDLYNQIGRTGEILCYSQQKKCNVIIKYTGHAQGDLLAKNLNINPSVTVGSKYGGTQGVLFKYGVRMGFKWKGDFDTITMLTYKRPNSVINNRNHWQDERTWWTINTPKNGISMGEEGERAFWQWMEEQKDKNHEYPQLTAKEETSIRREMVQSRCHHGVVKPGHALSWGYLAEIKHIFWRVFINRLSQNITINWVQHEVPFDDLENAIKKSFKNNTFLKQFRQYAKGKNSRRRGSRVLAIKLPGPCVDQLVMGYVKYLGFIDESIVKKHGIVGAFNVCYTDESDLSELPPAYVLRTWHNAVEHHLHCLWQEYMGILHIPQFYPKEQYGDGLPPELTRSIQLSVQIYDCLIRLQPHGVSLFEPILYNLCYINTTNL